MTKAFDIRIEINSEIKNLGKTFQIEEWTSKLVKIQLKFPDASLVSTGEMNDVIKLKLVKPELFLTLDGRYLKTFEYQT